MKFQNLSFNFFERMDAHTDARTHKSMHGQAKTNMLPLFQSWGHKKSSSRASGPAFASQQTDKNHQNSSDARLADEPKLKKKKTPAQVARDCFRQKAYWKSIKVARKLRE